MKKLSELSKDTYESLLNNELIFDVYPDATGEWDVDKLPESLEIYSKQSGSFLKLVKKEGRYTIGRDDMIEYVDRLGLVDEEVVDELKSMFTKSSGGKLDVIYDETI